MVEELLAEAELEEITRTVELYHENSIAQKLLRHITTLQRRCYQLEDELQIALEKIASFSCS